MSVQKAYRFEGLWCSEHWLIPAFVVLDENGNLIASSDHPDSKLTYENVQGFAIPGLQNAHSHAFQYAMVGLTEIHDISGNRDDFWGWRNAMYALALSLNPEQLEGIAAALYKEMLLHGYTEVAEFHYIHHDKDGNRYHNLAELGSSLIRAARKVGIRITLIPIFYQKGGFGKDPESGQRRFISKGINEYQQLLNSTAKAIASYERASLGCGIHSLRAVEPKLIKEYCNDVLNDLPFHIHVSEQKKEVDQSIEFLGEPPVAWLLNNVNLSEQYNLVHATHLNNSEIQKLAESNARVVLCPSTEGNLGDGIFNLYEYHQYKGQWSIGTDSHIGLNPFEELRILDYGQRLTRNRRNIFVDNTEGNSGKFAIDQLIKNGRTAMGRKEYSSIEKGDAFDVLIMDANSPLLSACSPENLLNTIIYASNVTMHLGTMVAGEWVIRKGKHDMEHEINDNFKKVLAELGNR